MQVGAERDAGGFSVLSRADCMRLLERGGVGRIAVPGESVPTMRPVNFALQDGRIVMRTPHGALWAAAVAGVGASFEIDEISNEDHRTWNVIVTGTLEALDAAGEAGRGSVNAWAPAQRDDRSRSGSPTSAAVRRPIHTLLRRCRRPLRRRAQPTVDIGSLFGMLRGSTAGVARSEPGRWCER